MAEVKVAKVKLPEGYGTAAPEVEGAAVYAKQGRRKRAARIIRKKKGSYIAFVKKFMKENKGASIADAAKAWKKEA